jgi:hypothetical protein
MVSGYHLYNMMQLTLNSLSAFLNDLYVWAFFLLSEFIAYSKQTEIVNKIVNILEIPGKVLRFE